MAKAEGIVALHVRGSYTEQLTNEAGGSDLRVEHMVGTTVHSYKSYVSYTVVRKL